MKHNNDFRYDLEFGKQGESMLHKMLSNEEGYKVEVKRDRQAHKTNNLYFEYQSRNKPSGIATTQAEYYAYFVTDTFCFIISVQELKIKLKRLVKEDKAIGNMPGGDKNTSLGVLVSIDNFLKE
jgi:hypothetical protein